MDQENLWKKIAQEKEEACKKLDLDNRTLDSRVEQLERQLGELRAQYANCECDANKKSRSRSQSQTSEDNVWFKGDSTGGSKPQTPNSPRYHPHILLFYIDLSEPLYSQFL